MRPGEVPWAEAVPGNEGAETRGEGRGTGESRGSHWQWLMPKGPWADSRRAVEKAGQGEGREAGLWSSGWTDGAL